MIVDAVESGEAALAAMRRGSVGAQPFEMIMVDTQMPGMDGLTLARKIRSDSALAKTPLVMMGASKKCGASAAGYSDEFEHRLSKPIRPSLLHATLCALLAPKPQILQKPVLDGASLAPSVAASRADGAALNATRILVVDDNLVNRQVAQKQLERLGYSADTVDGGNPLWRRCRARPTPSCCSIVKCRIWTVTLPLPKSGDAKRVNGTQP